MSHTVTITRTTTTTNGNIFVVNGNYLCTRPGILKLAQLLLGAACIGLVAYFYTDRSVSRYGNGATEQLFFLLTAVTFMIGTFCLLAACVVSLSTGSIISKTIYEVIYHGLACMLYLAASLTLIIEVTRNKSTYQGLKNYYECLLAASIMGLINTVLYLLSTLLANRSYRGL